MLAICLHPKKKNMELAAKKAWPHLTTSAADFFARQCMACLAFCRGKKKSATSCAKLSESVAGIVQTLRRLEPSHYTKQIQSSPKSANTTQVGKLTRGAVISPTSPVRMGSLVTRKVSGGGGKQIMMNNL